MANAVTKVEAIYHVPFLAHATMGCICARTAAKSGSAARRWLARPGGGRKNRRPAVR
jgi:hypothetical protein